MKQCNGYSSDSPLKVTILAPGWGYSLLDYSILNRRLAIQLAEFLQVKVTVLVPENSCSIADKRNAASYGVTIVEAKEQPGFDDPVDWLNFPPQELTTDIVVGVGKRLGKIAQIFKEHHQCKNIYVASDPIEDLILENKKLRERLFVNRAQGLSLERNIGLNEMADLPVAIGPKTHDEFSRRCHNKEVFKLTPGILREFSDVKHATADGTKFRMLIFGGGGNPDSSHQEGLGIVGKAVAELDDRTYHIVYVGSAKEKHEELAKKCGVAKNQLSIRSLPKSEEELKRLFHEADLAIMPSGEQGFGMVSLAALSAGLPVLVHGESGFGEALRAIPCGDLSTVVSEDPKVWAKAIKKLQKLNRKTRLEQAAMLRSSYDEQYSWEKQCGELVQMMLSMVSGGMKI